MADENASRHGRPRFWSRSKAQKSPKDNDSSPHTSPTFDSSNIDAFLKPSRDAFAEKVASTKPHLAPKLNIAIAKQWPETGNEVRLADAPSPPPVERFFYRKPTRRPGLKVSFSSAEPEIIGEGGDESLYPVIEVSKRKSMFTRSTSEKVPRPLNDGSAWPGTGISAHSRQPTQPDVEDPGRFSLRRAESSFGEMSPALRVRQASPPAIPPPRAFGREFPSNASVAAPGQSGGSTLTVQKQRDMLNSEGMAFRRASAMFVEDEDEDPDPPSGGPPQVHLTVQPGNLSKESLANSSPVSPPDVRSSPFVDPKYLNRQHNLRPEPAISQVISDAPALYGHPRAPQTETSSNQTSYMEVPPPPPTEPLPEMTAPPLVRKAPPPAFQEPTLPRVEIPGSHDSQSPDLTREPTLPDVDIPTASLQHHRQLSREQAPTLSYNPIAATSTDLLPRRSDQSQHTGPQIAPRKLVEQTTQDGNLKAPFYTHRSQSSSSLDPRMPIRPIHSSSGSRDHGVGQPLPPRDSSFHRSTSSGSDLWNTGLQPQVSNTSSQGPSPPGYARYPSRSPNYFSMPRTAEPGSGASPRVEVLRQEEGNRPPFLTSGRMSLQNMPSPPTNAPGDPAAADALVDFMGRVEHMKGVFSLTAEKERPADRCTPHGWLRTALWWHLKGKIGLEALFRQRRQSSEPLRELLMQPHVDLAKAVWIMNGPLEQYHSPGWDQSNQESVQTAQLSEGLSMLKVHLEHLALIMLRDNLMPPSASLIQGQDTRIWLSYAQFTPDAMASLCGNARRPVTADEPLPRFTPLEALPPGDSKDLLCYGRFAVDVLMGSDDSATDRMIQPCMLSVCRGSREYQMGIVIASQSGPINVRIGGQRPSSTQIIGWQDVSWRTSSLSLVVRLSLGFEMTVHMKEQDFRRLWNLVEYARKLENALRPVMGERLTHRVVLTEVQYADPSGASAFPADKLRHCVLFAFEKRLEERTATRVWKRHCGSRILLVTDPASKVLSFVSHEVCRSEPLLFEFMTDATAAHGETAMLLRIREQGRQCRMLLVFPDADTRQALYDVLNGLSIAPHELILARSSLTSFNIQPMMHSEAFTTLVHPALEGLQWAKLGVTNLAPTDSTPSPSVNSESLRIIARHATGCITDRLNLGKGEMLFRLPCSRDPAIQILREPQLDLSMSIDSRHSPPQVAEGLTGLLHVVQQQPTIRTFRFASAEGLHLFQAGLTNFTVSFDGIASNFGISRTMMVVSISHKWQASNVRVQVLTQGALTQVVAFMEGFSHADAMCFRVKSTDVFEKVKGNGKDKKWAVKMKDAKFSLPKQEKGEMDKDDVIRGRFINLDGLDYAEEHDDLTVGFDTEEERDNFACALPAETKVGRMITLRRRI